MRLAGKVALITGAASGIGRESAMLFAANGARVACVDRTVGANTETVKLISEAGGEAIALTADVSLAADVEATVSDTVEHFGGYMLRSTMPASCIRTTLMQSRPTRTFGTSR